MQDGGVVTVAMISRDACKSIELETVYHNNKSVSEYYNFPFVLILGTSNAKIKHVVSMQKKYVLYWQHTM